MLTIVGTAKNRKRDRQPITNRRIIALTTHAQWFSQPQTMLFGQNTVSMTLLECQISKDPNLGILARLQKATVFN